MIRLGRRQFVTGASGAAIAGLAGCTDGGDDQPPAERGPVSIDEFVFAASEPQAYGEYDERPDATYAPGSDVWLYASLEQLAAEEIDDGVRIHLDQRVRIDTPEDETWLDETETFRTELERAHLDRFYTRTPIGVPENALHGEYDVTIEFTDHVSDSTDGASGTFTIEE